MRAHHKARQLTALFSSISCAIRYLLRRLDSSYNNSRIGALSRSVSSRHVPTTNRFRDVALPIADTPRGLHIALDGGEPVAIMPSFVLRSQITQIDLEAQNPSTGLYEVDPQVATEFRQGLDWDSRAPSFTTSSTSASSEYLHAQVTQCPEGDKTAGSLSQPTLVGTNAGGYPQVNTPASAVQPKLECQSLSLDSDRIKPCPPELYQRYERKIVVSTDGNDLLITPGTRSFTGFSNPKEWTSHINPEGALYFFHEEKRVFTDALLSEPKILDQVHQDMNTIFDFMDLHGIERHPEVDLVLDMIPSTGSDQVDCFYYLADHRTRSIFFLDDFYAKGIQAWGAVVGVATLSHLRPEMEAQYWHHVSLFPRSFFVNHDVIDELRDVLVHAIADVLTSPTSTAPYGLRELQDMLSLANNMRSNTSAQYGASAWTIGRLMCTFTHQRFFNFYGDPAARLDTSQSVYGYSRGRRTWLIKCISPLLFYAPDVHLRSLEGIWMDGYHTKRAWMELTKKLPDEWRELTLFATVLLNANVAFLAIQSVDTHADLSFRSPAQITSYLSIITSIGSIVLGLLLTRTMTHSSARKIDHPILGLETCAILYSLPYALLMWAMTTFLLAFALLWSMETHLTTQIPVGITGLAVALLVILCIWVNWENAPKLE
ncbi:hypothetical protein BDN72DRAFT_822647 [Pluteus cervinus]|uniref:Uncharacterized protein n=1 Tax=Pluteus cervinus TaxID=181527 RepID=A0ACD3ANG8_9AGAR|nr:hypothetical protein BDN72DRAFT_822647 [Pluteus cervinus]